MLFFWTVYSSKNPENFYSQKINIDIYINTLIMIQKQLFSSNSSFRIVSEGSCDTEEVVAAKILLHKVFKIENKYFKL